MKNLELILSEASSILNEAKVLVEVRRNYVNTRGRVYIKILYFDRLGVYRRYSKSINGSADELKEAHEQLGTLIHDYQKSNMGKYLNRWIFSHVDGFGTASGVPWELTRLRNLLIVGETTLSEIPILASGAGRPIHKDEATAEGLISSFIGISIESDLENRSFTFMRVSIPLLKYVDGIETRKDMIDLISSLKRDIDAIVCQCLTKYFRVHKIEAPINVLKLDTCVYTRDNRLVYTFGVKGEAPL